jgi:hypothetical protein
MNVVHRTEAASLLPPAPGACPACGRPHDPRLPHDAQSLYYQYRFYGLRGRWPTWADAAAHCADHVRETWRELLVEQGGQWTEPEGEAIADPPAESLREVVEIPIETTTVDLAPGEGSAP